MSSSSEAAAPARTPAQIEADIARERAQLAATVDHLSERFSPETLAAQVKEQVSTRARGMLTRPWQRGDGTVDPVRVAATAAVGLLLVTYLVRRRRL